MPSHTFEQLLERACKLSGVDPGFWDIWGRYHETTVEAQQAILGAKGFDPRDAESLDRSLMEHARRDWRELLPPSIVTEESETLDLPVSVAVASVAEQALFVVRAEDGNVSEFAVELRNLPAMAI